MNLPEVEITIDGSSGITATECESNSVPSLIFCQLAPPSRLRTSQPSSMAPKIIFGSSGASASPLTWLTCGGLGKVQSIVSARVLSPSQSLQLSPPSLLLKTDDGPVPSTSSPVSGCCASDQASL